MIHICANADQKVEQLVQMDSIQAYHRSVTEHYHNDDVPTFTSDIQILITKVGIILYEVAGKTGNGYFYDHIQFLCKDVLGKPSLLRKFEAIGLNAKGNKNKHTIQNVHIDMNRCVGLYNELITDIADKYNLPALYDLLIEKKTSPDPLADDDYDEELFPTDEDMGEYLRFGAILLMCVWGVVSLIWGLIQYAVDGLAAPQWFFAVAICSLLYAAVVWMSVQLSLSVEESVGRTLFLVTAAILFFTSGILFLVLQEDYRIVFESTIIQTFVSSVLLSFYWRRLRDKNPYFMVAWVMILSFFLAKIIPSGSPEAWQWFIGLAVGITGTSVLMRLEQTLDTQSWIGWIVPNLLLWGFLLLFPALAPITYWIIFACLMLGSVSSAIVAFRDRSTGIGIFNICYILANVCGMILYLVLM